MAVYTDVSDDELRAFAALYDIGEVLSCKGIAEGVENSNFLVTTERGNFILTLYEKRVAPRDLPFFIALMVHLARTCVANGWSRFQWSVLDWNTPSIDFYKSLGAVLMDEWTVCRVSGDALAALARRGTL